MSTFASSRCASVLFSTLFLALIIACSESSGQIGYGVNEAGTLFKFDTDAPSIVTELGPVGFVPEGIDFRPGTNQLYAINVGEITTRLYTLDINNGAPTAVGAGFPSGAPGYNLNTANQSFGFDFNPKTLQVDNSMRIRFVSTNNTNLRLHSGTGGLAVEDGDLAFANGDSPFVDAVAYINNIPQMGGTTALYDMDSRSDRLLLQNPPNAGTVAAVGPFGVTVDALRGIGFDIYTTPGDADSTIGGDFGFAVLRRDATAGGRYLLYDVNLATGQISNGALVGTLATPYNFVGGFAVNPIPEPASLTTTFVGLAFLGTLRRRAR